MVVQMLGGAVDPKGWGLSDTCHKFAAVNVDMSGKQNGSGHAWSSQVQNGVFWQVPASGQPTMWHSQEGSAEILEDTGVHGYITAAVCGNWIIAAPLEEMKVLKEVASFESCETEFRYSIGIREGSVEAPTLWKETGTVFSL